MGHLAASECSGVDVHTRTRYLAGKGWVGSGGSPADGGGLFIAELDLVRSDVETGIWWWDDTAEVVYVRIVSFV